MTFITTGISLCKNNLHYSNTEQGDQARQTRPDSEGGLQYFFLFTR